MSEQTRQLAERIARDLFTSGGGARATMLVLCDGNCRLTLGGLTEYTVAGRIDKYLTEAAGTSVPQEAVVRETDRDVDLRIEMRAYLDTLVITGESIGDIRRSLFVPWDSSWNGWVRDDTAARERSQ